MNAAGLNSAKVPVVVRRFFDAANRFDLAAADCFTADATVRDERREYVGPGAIRAWIAEYRPKFVVMRAKIHGSTVALSVRVSGHFPGSPIELDYALTLRDDKISVLSIE